LIFAAFRRIADEVGAYLLVDMAHIAGLVAAGRHPSPLTLADFTSTTTHKTLRGPRGGMILIGKDKENNRGIKTSKGDGLKKWSELIDSSIMPGIQGGPLLHVIAAKAVAFKEALEPEFKTYIERVCENASILATSIAQSGARIVSGGTDTHLALVDLTPLGISGRDAETWLDKANITVNKNNIPFDNKSPFVASGIRVGSAALTTRGFAKEEMLLVGELVGEVLRSKGDEGVLKRVGEKVVSLTSRFPIP